MTRMFDSSNMHSTLTQSNSTSMILHSCATYATSRAQSDLVDEHQSKDSTLEVISEVAKSFGSPVRSNMSYPYRIRLEQDVQRLQQQLQKEMEMHAVLKDALEKNVFTVSCSSCLPRCVQEILSTISLLEGAISKLEQDIVSLHFHLSQERNERRLAEYNLKHSASQSASVHSSNGMNTVDAVNSTIFHKKNECLESDTEPIQNIELKRLPKGILPIGLWGHPNLLSEEMLRCMKNIFISLADSALPSKLSAAESVPSHASPRGHLSSSSWWSSSEHSMISSWVQSPQVDVRGSSEVLALENVFDPYEVRGKLSWLDIGNYSLATEVSWMSVAKDQLEYASGALRRFSILVEQLAKVNPVHLSCNEKLAFWINLYNALIMHAYLAYGVPRNDLKLFSLMQKAAYTVGGHSFNALSIEYLMLKMKPPLHRPQIGLLLALHKLKTSEEQRKSAIDIYEPLVQFALSSGMYSSPAVMTLLYRYELQYIQLSASIKIFNWMILSRMKMQVRVYSAMNVKEELQEALHDFVRASVGISNKGKLLVPKMLHCFAKSFVDDSNLAVWISHHLPPNQAAFVEQCISQRRQSFLPSRNCGILPFDSRFRYLFLPDKLPH